VPPAGTGGFEEQRQVALMVVLRRRHAAYHGCNEFR